MFDGGFFGIFQHLTFESAADGRLATDPWPMAEATDILLDTSTNDGLNLIPFNFYAAHSQAHPFFTSQLARFWVCQWDLFPHEKPRNYGWFTFGSNGGVPQCFCMFLVPKPSEPWKLPLSIPWYWFVSRYAHNGLVHNHQISINKPVSITPNNFTHGSTVTVKW